jgi:hypothetical protein
MDPKKLKARDKRNSKVMGRVSSIINPEDVTVLSGRLNVCRNTVKSWKNGYAIPTGSNMMGLCSLYGIPEEFIVKGVFKLRKI